MSAKGIRPILLGLAIAAGLVGAVGLIAVETRPVREVVAAYIALLGAANRQDLEAASRLCSSRYLKAHPVTLASEGGIVGLPRNIHKNFQAWRQGPHVWLCPTNRVGPVYQFVLEGGTWRFDGPIGLLRGRGEFVPYADLSDTGLDPGVPTSNPVDRP